MPRPHSTIVSACFTILLMLRLPFITFEGTEGSGKSTHIALPAERLRAAGHRVRTLREPGGTPIGETVRELLQYSPEGKGMCPETELLLFEASRSQLVRQVIKPALESGNCVISDRFFDSTTAYQGAARKLLPSTIDQLNAFAVGDCIPDLTIILDIDEQTARMRMAKPRKPDRMEEEPPEFYERVREAYRDLARREQDRVMLIDGSKPAVEIEHQVWELIACRFPELGTTGAPAMADPARRG